MDSLNDLIAAFKKFPGLGAKSARRAAMYLLKKDEQFLSQLGSMIANLKNGLSQCGICGNLDYKNPCGICSNPMRDRNTICIVEDIEALSAIEESGIYNGVYHVLGGRVSPMDDEDISDESIASLVRHIKMQELDEVIIATSPRIEGDMTSHRIMDIISKFKIKKVSRIAYGLPVGGSIEFADKLTLHSAFDGRSRVN